MSITKEPPVIIYSPDSQLRSPKSLIRSMVKDLSASRELAWRLFVRDLSAQYRQSLFGILWAFIPPIITSLIFIVLQSRNVINFGETDIPYPVYVLVGTVLWQLFSESLNAPLKSVTAAKAFLVKVNFPRESIILSAFYMVVFNSLVKAVILVATFLIFRLQITPGLILAPFAVLMLLLFGMGIGLLLTPLGMLYSDVSSSLPIIIQIFFFLTPVIYPPIDTFPLSLIAKLNPISPLLIASRDLITKGTISNLQSFVVVSTLSIIGLLVGWVIYRIALPIVIERISA